MMGQRLVKSSRCRRADPPLQRRSPFIIMQAEKQQAFKVNIQAKAKNFDFKFKSTQIVPAWKLHRLSISLKLRNFFLRVNSESTVHHKTKQNSESTALVSRRHPRQQQKQPLISRFLKIFKKLPFRCAKKPRYPEAESFVNRLKQFAYEEIISAGALATGVVAFLVESITSRPRKGVTGVSLVIVLLLLMVGLNNYVKYGGENVLDYIGMAGWMA